MMTLTFKGASRVLGLVAFLMVPQLVAAQQKATMPRRAPEAKPVQRLSVIEGAVTDTNMVPLAGAEVQVVRTPAKLLTTSTGKFKFTDVRAGQYLLIVKRAGYRPASAVIDVPTGDTLRLTYALERAAQGLAPVEITTRRQSLKMQEFDQRRKLGGGEYFTAEDLEKRAAIRLSDVLRYAKTMTIMPDATNNNVEIAFSKREGGGLNVSGVAYCPMQVYLDGIPLPSGFPMDLLPAPKMVSGIEVYSGPATAPMQFGGNDRRCGMVLVWTKDGTY